MSLSIFDAARETPDATFVLTDANSVSYQEMAAGVSRAVGWLLQSGAAPGRPFPVLATRRVRTLELLLGLFELGVPALLLHPRWTPQERAAVLSRARCHLQAPPECWPSQKDPGIPSRPNAEGPSAETCLAIVYTTGTTGTPRGVLLSRRAFEASARASAEVLPWGSGERWLLELPLAHVGGLSIVTRSLIARTAVVLPTAVDERFDPERTLRCVEQQRITRLSVVPTQLSRLLDASERCPASLRAVLVGGAAATETLLARARDAGWPLLATYGLSEACSQVTVERPGQEPQAGSSGPPLPGTDIRIVDSTIEVRSPSLLSGYFPHALAPISADGYFRTSDCGELRQGELFVYGRRDDVIVSGGENVHPLEVERVLGEHPGVAHCCAFGVPDARWGALVAVAVVPRTSDWRGLRAWLAQRLAAFKLPRRIALVNELPTNATGKVDRRAVARLCASSAQPLAALDADVG